MVSQEGYRRSGSLFLVKDMSRGLLDLLIAVKAMLAFGLVFVCVIMRAGNGTW